MWRRLAALGEAHDGGLVASVSSLLIMLVFQHFAKNAILMGRSISNAVMTLLRGSGDGGEGNVDGDVLVSGPWRRRRRRCERCGARRAGEDVGTVGLQQLLSGYDVAAVMASLGLQVAAAGKQRADEDAGAPLCGGCEATAVVEDLAESKAAAEEELREAFGVFDRDGDGFVSAGELWRVLRRLGMREGARYEDCARMVDARDGDGDGRLSFPEFRAMMEDAP